MSHIAANGPDLTAALIAFMVKRGDPEECARTARAYLVALSTILASDGPTANAPEQVRAALCALDVVDAALEARRETAQETPAAACAVCGRHVSAGPIEVGRGSREGGGR